MILSKLCLYYVLLTVLSRILYTAEYTLNPLLLTIEDGSAQVKFCHDEPPAPNPNPEYAWCVDLIRATHNHRTNAYGDSFVETENCLTYSNPRHSDRANNKPLYLVQGNNCALVDTSLTTIIIVNNTMNISSKLIFLHIPKGTAATCVKLEEPENGVIAYTNSTGVEEVETNRTEYPVNTTAEYSCDTGFELHPENTTRLCETNGKWTGENIQCKAQTCYSLEHPMNGSVSVNGSRPGVGSVAIYTCDEGYILTGSENRTCMLTDNGQVMWSGELLACIPNNTKSIEECPTNGTGPGITESVRANDTTRVLTVECTVGIAVPSSIALVLVLVVLVLVIVLCKICQTKTLTLEAASEVRKNGFAHH